MPLTHQYVQSLPKVLLHDHLDGGLRPQTVIDLARDLGHPLPADDATSLGEWFETSANSGSLAKYLETFAHTAGVMQTADGLRRVARECVLDLAADNVVAAETRYAPEQHLQQGLTLEEVASAVQEGLREGMDQARDEGHHIQVGTLITAMRHADRSEEIAELAVAFRDRGVVGFDIAGPEIGFPPERFAKAFAYLRRHNLPYTIHAGEAVGVESIEAAVHECGAVRIGHGVRLADEVLPSGEMSPFAAWIRDRQIVLELCPSSNVQTGVCESISRHPCQKLLDHGFTVTINTDNRGLSVPTLSEELHRVATAFDWTWTTIEGVTLFAASGLFASLSERDTVIREHLDPHYLAIADDPALAQS